MSGITPWWVALPVLAWLAAISYFDLRTREIPHAAWVCVPAALAAIWRVSQGGWPLAVAALAVTLISERQHLPGPWPRRVWLAAPPLFSGLTIVFGENYFVAILSVICFWVMCEMGAWGGADAMAAITLTLLWPGLTWVALLLAAALLVSLGLRLAGRVAWFQSHRLPGLPVMLLAAALYLALVEWRPAR